MHIHGGDIYLNKNVTDFSANINFKGTPDSVKAAAKAGVDLSDQYPDINCEELRLSIGASEHIPAQQVICGNGASELIFSLALAIKPVQALLMAPTFYEYQQALSSVGCELIKYRMKEERGFALQEDFLEKIQKSTDIIFLCNPNNPTGVLTETEFLEKVLRRCERCNTLLVVDECFNPFLENPEQYTMKHYLKSSEHLIILKAFTKIYAMAGLRLGYVLTNNAGVAHRMSQVTQPWNVSIPAQMAGIAALKEEGFLKDTRKELKAEKEFLQKGLAKIGYPILGSKANYIFFQGPRTLYSDCLEREFLIRDCSNYEGLPGGWYRIAVKGRKENEALLNVLHVIKGT
ncbi:aminotransferase class I/II-fold pyridoxal phosphate-dependent enzyme [Lachnospiraceae bacterium ZAX-1]